MRTEKFETIIFNNKTKQIDLKYASGKRVKIHYGQIGIKKKIVKAWVDPETGNHSVGFQFADGSEDYMPYDQPLVLAKDPEYLLQMHIQVLTAKIKKELKRRGVSKRFLATHLRTSDNQVQRLLNPEILNKNLEQLYRIAAVLGLEFEIRLKAAS